ncbi:hypothetical protein BL254_06040 [Protofrankia sp. BMG5.30]|nr:hypothetical protein BL254_06040 [Protofrankia sp. BMG5.30]
MIPPAASRQPPAASRQPPAASRQPPAASRQPRRGRVTSADRETVREMDLLPDGSRARRGIRRLDSDTS